MAKTFGSSADGTVTAVGSWQICSYPKVIRDWEAGRSFDVDAVCLQNIRNLFDVPVESLIDDDLRHTYKARTRIKWAERIRQLTGM